MKILKVNDEEAFYKKLNWYKSIFCRKFKFETESKEEEFNVIIKALNIKNRYKRIEYIYDYNCQKIDDYYKDKNICGFIGNKCIAHQKEGCKYINGCCSLCINQSGSGCETSNLSCKLFFCEEIKKNNSIIQLKDLKTLKIFSRRQIFIINNDFFSTRKEFIKDLYYGSIIIFGIRDCLRIIRNFFILKYQILIKKKKICD